MSIFVCFDVIEGKNNNAWRTLADDEKFPYGFGDSRLRFFLTLLLLLLLFINDTQLFYGYFIA